MDFIYFLFDNLKELLLHVDTYLLNLMHEIGPGLYLILFLIIFAETAFVIIPFLPGDSLLFAAGALTALENSPLEIFKLAFLLWFAAVFGDFVNYHIGKYIGPKVFTKEDSWLLNKKHLLKTQDFYNRHGGRTIIIARFVPIIRSFAPFIAGIGQMKYSKFVSYNIVGGFLWIFSFLYLGHFFGNLPIIQKNFKLVIIAIIIISTIPVFIEWWKIRKSSSQAPASN